MMFCFLLVLVYSASVAEASLKAIYDVNKTLLSAEDMRIRNLEVTNTLFGNAMEDRALPRPVRVVSRPMGVFVYSFGLLAGAPVDCRFSSTLLGEEITNGVVDVQGAAALCPLPPSVPTIIPFPTSFVHPSDLVVALDIGLGFGKDILVPEGVFDPPEDALGVTWGDASLGLLLNRRLDYKYLELVTLYGYQIGGVSTCNWMFTNGTLYASVSYTYKTETKIWCGLPGEETDIPPAFFQLDITGSGGTASILLAAAYPNCQSALEIESILGLTPQGDRVEYIAPLGDEVFPLWCDMTTLGGGFTLAAHAVAASFLADGSWCQVDALQPESLVDPNGLGGKLSDEAISAMAITHYRFQPCGTLGGNGTALERFFRGSCSYGSTSGAFGDCGTSCLDPAMSLGCEGAKQAGSHWGLSDWYNYGRLHIISCYPTTYEWYMTTDLEGWERCTNTYIGCDYRIWVR